MRFKSFIRRWFPALAIGTLLLAVLVVEILNLMGDIVPDEVVIKGGFLAVLGAFLAYTVHDVVRDEHATAEVIRKLVALERTVEASQRAVEAALVDALDGKRFVRHSHSELFRAGTAVARDAKKRLYLLAKSPILLTGPRPYNAGATVPEECEREQYEVLSDIAERARQGPGSITFRCGYFPSSLRRRMEEHPELKNRVKANLGKFYGMTAQAQRDRGEDAASRFDICQAPPQSEPLITFIVGDDRFAIWFKEAGDVEPVCITATSKEVSDALVQLFDSDVHPRPLEEVQQGLGFARTVPVRSQKKARGKLPSPPRAPAGHAGRRPGVDHAPRPEPEGSPPPEGPPP